MTRTAAHRWAFTPRFRRHAFGWRSQPAVQRVREAVAEIQKLAKKDPALADAGAVLFLEKVSPALEQVFLRRHRHRGQSRHRDLREHHRRRTGR
jgi:hypothetical protein